MDGNVSSGLSHREPARPTEEELRTRVLDRLARASGLFWIAVVVLGVLSLLGLAGASIRLIGGTGDRAAWGYYAAVFAWLLAAAQGAPLVAVVVHLTRAHWGRAVRRAAELWAVVGVVTALGSLPLLMALPPTAGRNTIWFDWPWGVPGFFDGLAIFMLAFLGLVLLYLAAVPDLAVARDAAAPGRSRYARLALGWRGTQRQWEMLYRGFTLLGVFYLMLYVFVHLLVSTDFSMSLVPGWRSSIYPLYTVVTGFQSAVALTIVTLALLRTFGGLHEQLGVDQFWALAKLLLALSLFWFYFSWSDFMTLWYGRLPNEMATLQLLLAGPYFAPFLLAALFMFVLPFLLLIWNRVRVSIWGPTLVSSIILIGLFFDRVRLYVSAWSIAGATGRHLEEIPATHFPDLVDVFIVVGAVALAALLYFGATRLFPTLSLWAVREGRRLEVARRFLLGHVRVIGKPR